MPGRRSSVARGHSENSLKIWPPQTLPPAKPTRRRHQPRPSSSDWAGYRACLRWDFGFTCALCLLHEADLYGGRTGEGLGGTTTEHRTPRSEDASQESVYENCLYACRFCNRSRSAQPTSQGGTRLLDPTSDTWSTHFETVGDQLLPWPRDRDAEYTHRAYELDDPRKVERRKVRRELVTDRLKLRLQLDGEISALLTVADHVRQRNLRRFGEILQAIQAIRADARRALEDLERYAAIPKDAPATCRCDPSGILSLPEELDRQTLDLPGFA